MIRGAAAASSSIGLGRWPQRRPAGAVPDRREQPRLPCLLRPSRVDRHLEGPPHQRDLRLRVDAREDHLRLRRQAHACGLGRRHVGPRGGLRGVQGGPPRAARPARRAVAAPAPAGRRLRLPEHEGLRLRGRRRDRHARTAGPRAGHRGDGRDRRPRPVPARRARRAGDGHGPRHHRHQDLRPRRRARPLRHPARADPRTSSASRATPRTTSRASPASATRPPPSCCRSGATSRACCPTSTASRARSASRT